MAIFITICPHCNAELDAQEDWVGMEVECPACQKSFTVEKNIPAKLELQPIQTNVQQPSENTKNCPFCGGVVKEKAIFCKHCKTDLNKNDVSDKSMESSFIFICSECNTAVELPESMKGKEYECQGCCETSIAKETSERDCPLCGEKIKTKATVCKHCKKKIPQVCLSQNKKNYVLQIKNYVLPYIENAKNFFNKTIKPFFITNKSLRLIASGLAIVLFISAVITISFASCSKSKNLVSNKMSKAEMKRRIVKHYSKYGIPEEYILYKLGERYSCSVSDAGIILILQKRNQLDLLDYLLKDIEIYMEAK